jgi:hypothetical protein
MFLLFEMFKRTLSGETILLDDDESDESAIYEIEFKIFDKQFKNVIYFKY